MKYFYVYGLDKKPAKIVEYPHVILPEVANKEGLYKFEMSSRLNDEVVEWLNENIGKDEWNFKDGFHFISFREKEGAMAFILRWS